MGAVALLGLDAIGGLIDCEGERCEEAVRQELKSLVAMRRLFVAHTFLTPTLLARDGPVPGFRGPDPTLGVPDRLPLPKICSARA